MEHISVTGSAVKYSMDEFPELQRQYNQLCDIVPEMNRELKELEGTFK